MKFGRRNASHLLPIRRRSAHAIASGGGAFVVPAAIGKTACGSIITSNWLVLRRNDVSFAELKTSANSFIYNLFIKVPFQLMGLLLSFISYSVNTLECHSLCQFNNTNRIRQFFLFLPKSSYFAKVTFSHILEK
jgi:hypothetical protein